MEETIQFEVQLERPVEQVWSLVTEPDSLATWMLGSFQFEPVSGSALVFRTDDQVRRGEVIEVEEGRRFAWRWTDGAAASEVWIELDGDSDRCRVTIMERLLPPRRWAKPSIPPMEASVA